MGVGPLASYFKGEVLHGRDTDIFTSNMCTPSPSPFSPLLTPPQTSPKTYAPSPCPLPTY